VPWERVIDPDEEIRPTLLRDLQSYPMPSHVPAIALSLAWAAKRLEVWVEKDGEQILIDTLPIYVCPSM